jgi:hypothetical protein
VRREGIGRCLVKDGTPWFVPVEETKQTGLFLTYDNAVQLTPVKVIRVFGAIDDCRNG